MVDIAGFWSYVHDDDDAVDGAIVKLARRVMAEFELLSAEPLRLFVDRDLEWGEEWKGRIDRELQETTFFIPIVTPRYFQSDECRRELVEFRTAAERFGVRQLLLPIYYVTVPEMEIKDPVDELMALVKAIQREDMRQVRLAEERDAEHRRLVNGLATQLLQVSRETEGLPNPPSSRSEPEGAIQSAKDDAADDDGTEHQRNPLPDSLQESPMNSPEDDDVGKLDVLAAGEEALERWGASIQELGAEIEVVGGLVVKATPDMTQAESFVAQLRVANRLANELDEPAGKLALIAQDYSTNLMTVDPAVQQLLDGARSDSDVKEAAGSKETFTAMLSAVSSSRDGATAIQDLIDNMEVPAAQSRELRVPLRQIQTSLRNIADGQKILDDWEAQIREIYGDSLP